MHTMVRIENVPEQQRTSTEVTEITKAVGISTGARGAGAIQIIFLSRSRTLFIRAPCPRGNLDAASGSWFTFVCSVPSVELIPESFGSRKRYESIWRLKGERGSVLSESSGD